MSWRDPNPFEQALLADTRGRWPEIMPLARCLALAPRIEPSPGRWFAFRGATLGSTSTRATAAALAEVNCGS